MRHLSRFVFLALLISQFGFSQGISQAIVSFSNAIPAKSPVTIDGFTYDKSYQVEMLQDGEIIASAPILAQGYFSVPAAVKLLNADGTAPVTVELRGYSKEFSSWDEAVKNTTESNKRTVFWVNSFNNRTISILPTPPAKPGLPPNPAVGLGAAIQKAGGWNDPTSEPDAIEFATITPTEKIEDSQNNTNSAATQPNSESSEQSVNAAPQTNDQTVQNPKTPKAVATEMMSMTTIIMAAAILIVGCGALFIFLSRG